MIEIPESPICVGLKTIPITLSDDDKKLIKDIQILYCDPVYKPAPRNCQIVRISTIRTLNDIEIMMFERNVNPRYKYEEVWFSNISLNELRSYKDISSIPVFTSIQELITVNNITLN